MPGTSEAQEWEFIPCFKFLHFIIKNYLLWIFLIHYNTFLFCLFNSVYMFLSCWYCYFCLNVNCVKFINASYFSLFFEILINSWWFLKVNSYSELLDLITGMNFQMALYIIQWHTVTLSFTLQGMISHLSLVYLYCTNERSPFFGSPEKYHIFLACQLNYKT